MTCKLSSMTWIAVIFIVSGCNSMMQDVFVGNPPNNSESFIKKGMTKESQKNDFIACVTEADKRYPTNGNYEIWESNYFYFQTCLLIKGYQFYPRGLDGSKASRCTAGGDAGGPACQSLKNIRNR